MWRAAPAWPWSWQGCAARAVGHRCVAAPPRRRPGPQPRGRPAGGGHERAAVARRSFDVVTSFRGIWGTTPSALAEVYRVLVPGGRVGLTVWGHIKASPGAWAFAPFTLASEAKVQNQATMVALGRPGAARPSFGRPASRTSSGSTCPSSSNSPTRRPMPRGLASTGPAYEAILSVGEEAFLKAAVELGRERVREGLPLRARSARWATSQSSRHDRPRRGDSRPATDCRRRVVLRRYPTALRRGPAALRRRRSRATAT